MIYTYNEICSFYLTRKCRKAITFFNQKEFNLHSRLNEQKHQATKNQNIDIIHISKEIRHFLVIFLYLLGMEHVKLKWHPI